MQDELSPIEYFESALPKILRLRGAQATALGVNVRFIVTGRGGGTWTIRLRPPAACVVPGSEWKADLTIKITVSEMVKMLAGTFDARAAIAVGNIELLGDLTVLRSVGFLFQGREVPTRSARPRSSRSRRRGTNTADAVPARSPARQNAGVRRPLPASGGLGTRDHRRG